MRNSHGISTTAGWKKTLLLLCAFLIVACGPPALASIPAEYILFRPGPYLEASEQLGLYRTYPVLLLDFVSAGGNLLGPGFGDALLRYLHQRGAEQVLAFLFPEDWVRGQVGTLVRQFWSYYNLETPRLDLGLDFRPVKARLGGEEGMAVIRGTVAEWPPCSAADGLNILGLLLQGKTEDLPQCLPPRLIEDTLFGALHSGLSSLAQAVPDRVQLLPYQSAPPTGVYRDFRLGLRCMPVALLLLSLLAAGLEGFSARRFGTWVALPLYVAGLVSALSAAVLAWSVRWLALAPAGLLPGPALEVYAFFSQVLLQVFMRFLFWMAAAGVAAAGLGLALYLLRLEREA